MTSVMVVEDNEIIREHIANTVDAIKGFQVTHQASCGDEAVSAFDPDDTDIVLMDIEMETSKAGIEAASAILTRHPDADIIYLSSHDDDDMVITAMATGAKDFLVKGCSDEELKAHLEAVRDGDPTLDKRVQRLVMKEYKRLSDSEQSLLYFIRHLGSLTNTERELIACFLEGMKVKEIAHKRCVEPVTVKSQIRTLLQKFELSRTSEIVSKIRELKIEHLF